MKLVNISRPNKRKRSKQRPRRNLKNNSNAKKL